MTTIMGAVQCAAFVLDDGMVCLVPEDSDLLEQLRRFHSSNPTGAVHAEWDAEYLGEGRTVHSLIVGLATPDEDRIAIACIVPEELGERVPEGPLQVQLIVDESRDPENDDVLLLEGYRFPAPALRVAADG